MITVIMPVHNGESTLGHSVPSVLHQSFPDWELILIDDGSSDSSRAICQQYSYADQRIRVLGNTGNSGPASARNLGLRASMGTFIAYLDCDDEFHPDYLEHVGRLSAHSDLLLFQYEFETTAGFRGQWNPARYKDSFFEKNVSAPLGVAHRRSLFDQIGGFNETLWQQEDWDYWKRIARACCEIMFVKQKSGVYRMSEDGRSGRPRLTEGQRLAYEGNVRKGTSLYDLETNASCVHEVQNVLFAATLDTSSLLPSLFLLPCAHGECGFRTWALCETSNPEAQERAVVFLKERGLELETRTLSVSGLPASLVCSEKGRLSLTFLEPGYVDARASQALYSEAFLAFYESSFANQRPDVMVTVSPNPKDDPIVRLARRRDIPIVALLLDGTPRDASLFYGVDYCVVFSDQMRSDCWERLGLFCNLLPYPDGSPSVNSVYRNFFEQIRHQPGPPYIPERGWFSLGAGEEQPIPFR